MQALLYLPFAETVKSLLHIAQLHLEIVPDAVAHGGIGPVAVKKFHRAATANVLLPIDEQFIVERQVNRTLLEAFLIEGHRHKKVVAKAGPEILVFHKSLLIAKAVLQIEATAYFLWQQGLLVNPAFVDRGRSIAKLAGGDVAITQSKKCPGSFGLVGDTTPEQKLLQVTQKVPIPELYITLETPGPIFDLGIPEIHVPGTSLVRIDLGLSRQGGACKKQEYQKAEAYGLGVHGLKVRSPWEMEQGQFISI